MGNVGREKMSESLQQYFFQRDFSQQINNNHEMSLKCSPFNAQPSFLNGRKLQLMTEKYNRKKRTETDVGLPIDLSVKNNAEFVNIFNGENGVEENDNSSNDEEDYEVEEDNVARDDEPLNLSTHGGNYVNNDAEKRQTPIKDEEDLLQKRIRLEEMVSYIRKCSVVEGIDPSAYAGVESEVSESDSDNDERSINSMVTLNHHGSSAGHRRKPYRSSVVRVSHESASYPVLRQQLLRSVNGDEGDAEDDQSGSGSESNGGNEEESIGPNALWTAYDYATYYASVLHRLQTSLPMAAAAQGLIMNATSAAASVNGKAKSKQEGEAESQRKRAPRALTGKHVKHGTGASPATLLTLRQKIEQKMSQQQQHQTDVSANNSGKRRTVMKKGNKRKGTG